MRIRLHPWAVLLLSGFFLTTAPVSRAQEVIVASWTFEGEFTTGSGQTIGPISAEVGAGVAGGFHADNQTSWTTPAGNGSPRSLSSNRWSAGDYYQFEISTSGVWDLALSWDLTRSSTGPSEWELQYSTNLDLENFVTLGGPFMVTDHSWSNSSFVSGSRFSMDLSELEDLNDKESIIFRLVTLSSPGWQGTARVDNFTVTAIPEPSTWTLILGSIALAGAAGFRRRFL